MLNGEGNEKGKKKKKKRQQQQQNKVKQNNRSKAKQKKTFSACSRRFLQLLSTTLSYPFYRRNVTRVVYYVEN